MANKDHLKILKEGTEAWNQWRIENSDVAPNLFNANLKGANLAGANLSYTNLVDANLSGCDLNGADLSGAHLHHADLSGAKLESAELPKADLCRANLSKTNLSGAHISGADLSEANLSDADLSYANLGEANFAGCNLTGVDVSGSKLLGTIFANSNLSGAKGLNTCEHYRPSTIDLQTLQQSGSLPEVFLRGCGLPEEFITYLPSFLDQPIQFYSCFISYNHEDKSFARRIHDALQGHGIRCWLDEKQMLPGDDIYESVDHGIRLWDKVLLCCSKHSLTSWWVDNEVNKAFEKERQLMKERGKKVLALIPLDLDGYLIDKEFESGKKSELHSRLAGDFKGWDKNNSKFETTLERVIKALRADGGGREKPPKAKI